MPPVYNEARLTEKPLPLLVLLNQNDDSTTDDIESNDEMVESLSNTNQDLDADLIDFGDENASGTVDPLLNIDDVGAGAVPNVVSVAIESEMVDPLNVVGTGAVSNVDSDAIESETVDPLLNIDVVGAGAVSNVNSDAIISETVDPLAALNLCDRTNGNVNNPQSHSRDNADAIPTIICKEEPTFNPLDDADLQAIDGVFNESYEQCDSDGEIYIEKSNPVPPPCVSNENPYQTKKNDILSANIAFATDVSFFSYSLTAVKCCQTKYISNN